MAPSSKDENIRLLITDVVQASKLPPKSRTINIKPVVAELTSAAYEHGLLPDALSDLIDLVTTPNHLDQASLAAIVRNLYSATRVSRDVGLRVVGSFGHGRLKPSLNIQAALLRWLILVYHVLESPEFLSQAYQALFCLLDTAATRPQLSHLLALITRRKHVKPFRIQNLLNLSRQTGNDPSLIGLLRVFKDYYPEIIVAEAVRGKAAAFKHPDPIWRARLDEIQEAHAQSMQDLAAPSQYDGFRVNRPINSGQRRKAIPLVQTYHASEKSITLEEVENATKLAQNLEKIQLPNQMVAVLADPLLQKLLLLSPNGDAFQRITNWLQAVLDDVINGGTDEDTFWDIIDVLREFVLHTKTVPPVLLSFFARFFEIWDGAGRRDLLLDIVAYTPLHEYDKLYSHIFQPLETAFLCQDPSSHAKLLVLYTRLLRHWSSLLFSIQVIPDHASSTVSALVQHVGALAQTLAQSSPSVSSFSTILDFYEQFVRLISDERLRNHIRIELPPSSLIYMLFFSNSLVVTSRLCHVLAFFKKGFEMAVSGRSQQSGSQNEALSYRRAYVNRYNGFLMDFCNCLWRSRAFSDSDTNAVGCLIPRPVVAVLTDYVPTVDSSSSLAPLFGLSYSPVLCYQSIESVRDLEDNEMAQGKPISTRHAGPVTQASLARLTSSGGMELSWQEYRIKVLHGLTDKGFPGVAELLKSTMTVLKNTMEGQAGIASQGSSQ
ncbi:unnamed protein product [Clonostachys rosea]|uniref:Mis6 domain protein n=1 Tax=Bionectria ochroleuca TaxID=29856 RepID=A0ABY6TTY4_BIOOC|nr:unnamed protein product [Clonostachys rosea]